MDHAAIAQRLRRHAAELQATAGYIDTQPARTLSAFGVTVDVPAGDGDPIHRAALEAERIATEHEAHLPLAERRARADAIARLAATSTLTRAQAAELVARHGPRAAA